MNDVTIEINFLRPTLSAIYDASNDLISKLDVDIQLTTPQQFFDQLDENQNSRNLNNQQNRNTNQANENNQNRNNPNECAICFEELKRIPGDIFSLV